MRLELPATLGPQPPNESVTDTFAITRDIDITGSSFSTSAWWVRAVFTLILLFLLRRAYALSLCTLRPHVLNRNAFCFMYETS